MATIHRWRKKYGMMDVGGAKRLKALEKGNSELKKMYADAMLGIKVLEVISELIEIHGSPGYIRSDNSPEFIA